MSNAPAALIWQPPDPAWRVAASYLAAGVMWVFAALLLFVSGCRAAPTPIGSLAGLWRSGTMYQDWMEPPHDAGWLRPRSHWPAVPQWHWPSQYNKTDPFTSEMATDGLLGGWNFGSITGGISRMNKTSPPDLTQDIAYRSENGTVAYRWPLVDLRLDDMVANGVQPFVMLGRVPWSLSAGWPASVSQCTYGNAAPPANFTEWGELVGALCEHMLARYGPTVQTWRFRILTEPNQPDSFTGTVTDFEKMYDYAAAAIRRVLGQSARIGPGQFCRYCSVAANTSGWQGASYRRNSHDASYWAGVHELMEHFARGTNWATGAVGSPVDFLGLSNYGSYGGAPVNKVGYQPGGTAASGVLLSQLRTQLGAGFEHATLVSNFHPCPSVVV